MPVPIDLLRFFDRAARPTGQARPAAVGIKDSQPDAVEVPVPEVPALAVPPRLAASPAKNAPRNARPMAPATA